MPKNKNLSGNLFTQQTLTIKETSLSKTIADWLDAKRIYNDRLNSGKVNVVKTYKGANGWKEYTQWIHLCKKGTPDRFAILNGQIIFIEVKKKGKKPKPDQIERHRELAASGAMVIVADSFDSFLSQFPSK